MLPEIINSKIPENNISSHEINIVPNPTQKDEQQPLPNRIENLFRTKMPVDFYEPSLAQIFQGGPFSRSKYIQISLWSWVASSIDFLIVFSMSCMFALLSISILGAEFKTLTEVFSGSIYQFIAFSFSLLFYGYLIITRVFIGSSIGEWACGLKMGLPKERANRLYGVKVVFRTTLIFLTGVISLPLLSLILKKDIAGKLCGVHLVTAK